MATMPNAKRRLNRTAFSTSRALDFFSEKELTAQIGHPASAWPVVLVKELIDNALDACEEHSVQPQIKLEVSDDWVAVTDNGPGIPPETVARICDYTVRVSAREAYVAPDRGAQGNALKTVLAMPFVVSGTQGRVEIAARGLRHDISVHVDPIRQEPVVDHQSIPDGLVKNGTQIKVHWPRSNQPRTAQVLQVAGQPDDDDHDGGEADLPRSFAFQKPRVLQIAQGFAFLNPHLGLTVDYLGERIEIPATEPNWAKWTPADPTCPHWYRVEHLSRLAAAYIVHDRDRGQDRTVREFIAEFRGLTGSAKQKAVLDATGLARKNLSSLATAEGLDQEVLANLLAAMQEQVKPVKPQGLGVLGREHIAARFESAGCEMGSFSYRRQMGTINGLPWVLETAFAWNPSADDRQIITGINWSPGILNPFRELGTFGQSLDSLLERQRAGRDEPIVLLLHLARPRMKFADRGKSSVVIEEQS